VFAKHELLEVGGYGVIDCMGAFQALGFGLSPIARPKDCMVKLYNRMPRGVN